MTNENKPIGQLYLLGFGSDGCNPICDVFNVEADDEDDSLSIVTFHWNDFTDDTGVVIADGFDVSSSIKGNPEEIKKMLQKKEPLRCDADKSLTFLRPREM